MPSRFSGVPHLPIVIVLFLGAATPLQAQQTGALGGRIVAESSGEPLAGATVVVRRDGDTTAVASIATTAQGRFRVPDLAPGRYGVTASFVGFTTGTVSGVDVTAGVEAEAGTLRLEVAPVELEAIEAQTERSPVQILTDRTVYTTKDMPAATGGTATELLRQVPELEVDVNGKVMLRGNQAVAIHLNGRPAPMQGDALVNFLQQMPADRIAKVEVMPNPTARHDPEGTGGIVNIILRENADLGLSGNVSGRAGSRGTRGFNGRIAYQKGRLTFFGGAGLSFSDDTNDSFDVRRNLLATPVTVLEQQGRNVNDNTFRMFDLTTEYKLGARTTAWLSAMSWGGGYTNSSATLYGLYDDARVVLDLYDRITESDAHNGSADFAVGVKHVFQPQRHELTIDVRRNGHGNDGGSRVEKLSRMDAELELSEIREMDQDSDNRGTTLRVDYTRPWGEKGKVDVGVNIGRRRLDEVSLQEIYGADATLPIAREATGFGHHEDFNSLYLTAAQTFGKLGLQFGLRGEMAETRFALRTTDEDFRNDYQSLFPSANLSYAMGEGRTVRFNYSKRISRPYSGLLNPYVPNTDPLNRRVGNPYLDPSYTHSLGLDYSRIGRMVTLRVAPFYRRTVNGWESIKRVDEEGVSTVTWENTASTQSMGSNFTASVRPAGRLSGSTTVGLFRTVTDASNISPEFSRDTWRWSVGGNMSARISSSLSAQMNGNFSPAREVPQGRISSSFYSGVSLRQQLMNNRATLSLFANDPLGLSQFRFETRDRTHVQNSRTTYSQRTLTLSFTMNFGKPPQQVSRRDGPETADETARIR